MVGLESPAMGGKPTFARICCFQPTPGLGDPMWRMKLSAFLLIGITVACPATSASPPPSAEQALGRMTVELMEAVERKDRKGLETLVADDFALRMPGDTKGTGRDEWLANAMDMDWSNFHFQNILVRVRGDHATVSSKLRFRVSPFPFGLDSGVVDTWERRNGRWQITGRYLGESSTQLRLAFAAGLLSAAVLAGLTFGFLWLTRRSRKRAR